MTTDEALSLAQRVHPLELVARLDYMQYKWDACDVDDMAAWADSIEITRNGRARLGYLRAGGSA